jgi:hypothetical protein
VRCSDSRRLRPAAPTPFSKGLHERGEAIFGRPLCYGNPRIASLTFSRLHSLAAVRYFRRLGWCLFGIADIVVAAIMGAMTSPAAAHLLALKTPNLLIESYPLVMHPFYGVPLGLMLHGLVLWRLRRGAASTRLLAAA